MKKCILPFIVIFITLFIISCNDNETIPDNSDSKNNNEKIAEDQNATENNKIVTSILEKGILIKGASKKTGNPPAPNSKLDFKIDTKQTEAFKVSGFNIKFSSNANIAGAYIRFKDVDGNPTSNYFDVPTTKKTLGKKHSLSKLTYSSILLNKKVSDKGTQTENNTEIDVNFSKAVPAGKFCYDICIYDTNNNISRIETICVTVEAWGGNAKISGEWILDSISNIGINEAITCKNGNTIKISSDDLSSSKITVNFNKDGSYNDSIDGEENKLNYNETIENCSASFTANKVSKTRKGNWAYNEDNNSITIMIFNQTNLLNSKSENIEFGKEYFNGITIKEVSQNMMILEENISNQVINNLISKKITYVFKRK